MAEKIVTFRFKQYFPPTDLMSSVTDRIAAHAWTGETAFPARLEWFVSKDSKPAHFPIDPVCFTQEDADALLASMDALDAIVCSVPVDLGARKAAAAAAKARREKEKADARPKQSETDPSLVKPSLRFLLEPEAREEGKWLADRLDFIPGGAHALVLNADRLDVNFPLIARADEVLGGAIREMLRAAGTLPVEVKDGVAKASWISVARCIRDGKPHFLTAQYVNGKKVPGTLEQAIADIAALRRRMDSRGTNADARAERMARRAIEDRAANTAYSKARDELGLSILDFRRRTPAEEAYIDKAMRDAVAAVRASHWCPF
jgi:hypothetical protein